MSFNAPPWMLATDRELVEQFVQAKRLEVQALWAAVERMRDTHAFAPARWKLAALIKEADFNAAQLAKLSPVSETP